MSSSGSILIRTPLGRLVLHPSFRKGALILLFLGLAIATGCQMFYGPSVLNDTDELLEVRIWHTNSPHVQSTTINPHREFYGWETDPGSIDSLAIWIGGKERYLVDGRIISRQLSNLQTDLMVLMIVVRPDSLGFSVRPNVEPKYQVPLGGPGGKF